MHFMSTILLAGVAAAAGQSPSMMDYLQCANAVSKHMEMPSHGASSMRSFCNNKSARAHVAEAAKGDCAASGMNPERITQYMCSDMAPASELNNRAYAPESDSSQDTCAQSQKVVYKVVTHTPECACKAEATSTEMGNVPAATAVTTSAAPIMNTPAAPASSYIMGASSSAMNGVASSAMPTPSGVSAIQPITGAAAGFSPKAFAVGGVSAILGLAVLL